MLKDSQQSQQNKSKEQTEHVDSITTQSHTASCSGGGRKALTLLAALMALLVCTNALLSFLIEPYMGSSEEMWQGFVKVAGNRAVSFNSDHNVESTDIAIPDAANDSGNSTADNTAACLVSCQDDDNEEASVAETGSAGPLNTVIVGTSMGLSGIDPEVLDASLGSRSFNMCTNMQSLSASLAAIQTAQEYASSGSSHRSSFGSGEKAAVSDGSLSADGAEKYSDIPDVSEATGSAPDGLRRVILVLDHEILMDDGNGNFRADASFWHGKGTIETLPRCLADGIRFMTSPDYIGEPASLLYPFPWIYNRSLDIERNLSEKRTHTFADPEGHRTAQGFEPSDEVIDQNIYLVDPDEADAWDEQNPDLIRPFISDDSRRKLTLLAAWCQESSIELDAMIIPFPNWLNIYQKDAYLAVDDELQELFASCGASFADYNLIPRETIGLTSTDFKDVGHMNTHGAQQFTRYLASARCGQSCRSSSSASYQAE